MINLDVDMILHTRMDEGWLKTKTKKKTSFTEETFTRQDGRERKWILSFPGQHRWRRLQDGGRKLKNINNKPETICAVTI